MLPIRNTADRWGMVTIALHWLTVIAVTAAQFAVTYLPPLQAVFGTASVPFLDGVLIFAVGVALFALVEIEKQLRLLIQGRIAGDGIAHGH